MRNIIHKLPMYHIKWFCEAIGCIFLCFSFDRLEVKFTYRYLYLTCNVKEKCYQLHPMLITS